MVSTARAFLGGFGFCFFPLLPALSTAGLHGPSEVATGLLFIGLIAASFGGIMAAILGGKE